MEKVEITVLNDEHPIRTVVAQLPLELGRQSADDLETFREQRIGSHQRVAIAPIENVAVPRSYIQLSALTGKQLRAANLHRRTRFAVAEPHERDVGPGEAVELPGEFTLVLPTNLVIGIRLIDAPDAAVGGADGSGFRTLSPTSDAVLDDLPTRGRVRELIGEDDKTQRGKVAVQLVRQSLDVLKKAAGSDEYFDSAVRRVAEMVELDRAFVILYEQEQWQTRASFSADSDTTQQFPE